MFITRPSKPKQTDGKRWHALGQSGDTIIEVMIAITIVSMVLGGAYVTTNNSLLDTRSAQERSNAVKLAETQIEYLRSLSVTNSSAIFGGSVPSPFCVSNAGTVVASNNSSCAVDSTGATTTAQCNASGKPSVATTSAGPIYCLADTQASTTSGGFTYTTFGILVTWDSINGANQDTLQMSYRLDQ